MADLGREILAAVQKAFTNKAKTDIVIADLQKRLSESGVSYREAEEYAARIGELLSRALQENITAEILPDGKMPLELAEEILRPLLTQNYEEASRVAAQVQKSLNQRAGLGMNALQPEVNEDRATGIIEKISSYDSYEDGAWLTGEPVVNYTQSAVEDTIRKNADAHFEAGLSPKIKRIATGGCCRWCRSLAGTYDYPVDRDVYRRHENCRCLVLYDPRDGKIQDAHTKVQYKGSMDQAEKAARDARIRNAERIEKPGPKKRHRVVRNSELENGLPINSLPDSVMDKADDDGKILQRRIYGPNGRAETDFDTSDHNDPVNHPTGAHKHVFDYKKKNPHGPPLPLTDPELEENSDIIQRGVNYHDAG